MPYEIAMRDELSRYQFYTNAQRLATALEVALADTEQEIKALRADVSEWKARADNLADALRNCLELAYNCHPDELPNAIITTASKAIAKYDMLAAFSDALGD